MPGPSVLYWIGTLATAFAAVLVVRRLTRLLRDRLMAGPRLETAHSWPGSRRPARPPRTPAPAGRDDPPRPDAPAARARRRWPFA